MTEEVKATGQEEIPAQNLSSTAIPVEKPLAEAVSANPDVLSDDPRGVQARIANLTRKVKIEQEKNARLLAEKSINANYASGSSNSSGSSADTPGPERPDRVKYPDPHDYADAMLDFNEKKKQSDQNARNAELNKQQMAAYTQSLNLEHGRRIEAFKKNVSDFDETINAIAPMFNQAQIIAIQKSPKGAEIAYFLGKNPEEAYEFKDLDPFDAAIRVGQLTERFGNKQKSNTLEPMTTVQGASSPQIGVKANSITALRKRFRQER